jgi:hypothetical protein
MTTVVSCEQNSQLVSVEISPSLCVWAGGIVSGRFDLKSSQGLVLDARELPKTLF